MRIVLLTSTLEGGGAARVLVNMANHWSASGHDVFLFSFEDGSQPSFYPVSPGVRVKYLSMYKQSKHLFDSVKNNLSRIYRLRKGLLDESPDVVISFIDTANILVIASMLGTGLPVVVSERIHPGYHDIGWRWNALRKAMYRFASALVVQTREIADSFDGWRLRALDVIPNPVFLPPGGGEVPELGKPTILAVGRLYEQKGYDLLLRSFAAVERKEWTLSIAGTGPQREELERLALDLGVADEVVFLGQVSNVQGLLAQADIYVMSSYFEGFPNALCEAMAAGVACISTDCPSGPADIIEHGVNGLLVANRDESALRDAMLALMDDPGLRDRLAKNARDVVNTFSEEKVMKLWEQCIATVRR